MKCKTCKKEFAITGPEIARYAAFENCSEECWKESGEYYDKRMIFDWFISSLNPKLREVLKDILEDCDSIYLKEYKEHLDNWIKNIDKKEYQDI
jgi:hypothetical protein